MNRNLLTDEERATLAEQWPELVVKHTNGGACNFQAAADELVKERDAEIERLRKLVVDDDNVMRRQREELLRLCRLLREGYGFPALDSEEREWKERVREALGE